MLAEIGFFISILCKQVLVSRENVAFGCLFYSETHVDL